MALPNTSGLGDVVDPGRTTLPMRVDPLPNPSYNIPPPDPREREHSLSGTPPISPDLKDVGSSGL